MQGSYLSSKMEDVDVRWFKISTWIDSMKAAYDSRNGSVGYVPMRMQMIPLSWIHTYMADLVLVRQFSERRSPSTADTRTLDPEAQNSFTRFLRYSDFYMHGSTTFFLGWKTTTYAIVFRQIMNSHIYDVTPPHPWHFRNWKVCDMQSMMSQSGNHQSIINSGTNNQPQVVNAGFQPSTWANSPNHWPWGRWEASRGWVFQMPDLRADETSVKIPSWYTNPARWLYLVVVLSLLFGQGPSQLACLSGIESTFTISYNFFIQCSSNFVWFKESIVIVRHKEHLSEHFEFSVEQVDTIP